MTVPVLAFLTGVTVACLLICVSCGVVSSIQAGTRACGQQVPTPGPGHIDDQLTEGRPTVLQLLMDASGLQNEPFHCPFPPVTCLSHACANFYFVL